MDENQLKLARMIVIGCVLIVAILIFGYQAGNWHYRKMAERQLCLQPVPMQNTGEDWAWGKCK